MTEDVPPAARSTARRRAAQLAWILGAGLLLVALSVRILTREPGTDLASRRALVAFGGAVCVVVAVVLCGPKGRRRAAAVVVSSAVALVIGEAALRLFEGRYFAAVYRVNETWLFEHVPGARKLNPFRGGNGTEQIPFDVNSGGFRGPELRPGHSGKRVVVYGDSFIAARATWLADTYPERLASELRTALATDVEAVNAGVVGYGPDQICLRMDAELPRLAPDLVVVSVLAENDYGDLLRNRLFELGPGGELRRRAPVIPAAMRDAYDDAQSALMVAIAFHRFEERMHAVLYEPRPRAAGAGDMTDSELEQCHAEYQHAVVEHDDTVISWWADHPDADLRLDPASAAARHKVELMSGVLTAIRDVAKKHAVPLLLLVIPSASDVCPGYDMDAVDVSRFPAYRPENLTRPIERIADAAGIAHVDLFEPFRAADANALYFHGGDTHWNAAGQALAAKLTARRIVESRLMR